MLCSSRLTGIGDILTHGRTVGEADYQSRQVPGWLPALASGSALKNDSHVM